MTKKEMEARILSLEKQLANLAARQGARDNENSSMISSVDSKTTENKNKVDEVSKNAEVNLDALQVFFEETIPEVDYSVMALTDTLDMILTEIIPSVMTDEI